MMTTLYHNPRCSKSRQALALLEEKNIQPKIVLYLETPLDEKSLKALIKKLGIPARELLRKGEDEYKALGLNDPALSDSDAIAAMCKHPKLMERPIVVHGNHAVIGRPVENILEILS